MEIERLHKMLTDAGIEHEWLDRTPPGEMPRRWFGEEIVWGWQIIVYKEDGERLVSAIEGYGSYGYGSGFDLGESNDLIEIMGLLTPEEEEHDSVAGWLTAEEVFRRIMEALAELKEKYIPPQEA